MRKEANIKLVDLVGEHTIVYDWANAGSRKGKKKVILCDKTSGKD